MRPLSDGQENASAAMPPQPSCEYAASMNRLRILGVENNLFITARNRRLSVEKEHLRLSRVVRDAVTRRLLARIETRSRSRSANLQAADRKVRHARKNIPAQCQRDRGRRRAAQYRAQYRRVSRLRTARERTLRVAEYRRASGQMDRRRLSAKSAPNSGPAAVPVRARRRPARRSQLHRNRRRSRGQRYRAADGAAARP